MCALRPSGTCHKCYSSPNSVVGVAAAEELTVLRVLNTYSVKITYLPTLVNLYNTVNGLYLELICASYTLISVETFMIQEYEV